MKLVTIYGSPTPPGKLARALELLETGVRERHPGWEVERIAPASTITPVVATWRDDVVEKVSGADAVVISSPVFRGSITGTLKLLIDMLPVEALRSKPVAILTVAAAPHHFLSAERHLRDVLSWFGALTAPNSAFFVDRVFAADTVDDEVRHELHELADQVVVLAERLSGRSFGPDPLTVRYRKKTSG
ncbi:NADPH-dependent FMN reductase [Thermostaphylospora chromogena]|uniref:FMN reductase n=1 Tax=Thermostaphylospora chromogena TaxID=35622 RepID=A0A1H1D1C8_9ACTN|nr:NADPH-dependent FMN reductase [Thermostaphylospora chromogena]SDQ70069.1 FMN reductase [Thermostaphylospora chromogena]